VIFLPTGDWVFWMLDLYVGCVRQLSIVEFVFDGLRVEDSF
jgi:hypothetical protein